MPSFFRRYCSCWYVRLFLAFSLSIVMFQIENCISLLSENCQASHLFLIACEYRQFSDCFLGFNFITKFLSFIFRQNATCHFCLLPWAQCSIIVRSSSSITKWASRIYQDSGTVWPRIIHQILHKLPDLYPLQPRQILRHCILSMESYRKNVVFDDCVEFLGNGF